MSWVTLDLRSSEDKIAHNFLEHEDVEVSREIRALDRFLSTQKSIIQSKEMREIRRARTEYDQEKLGRPKREDYADDAAYDTEYKRWSENFTNIKEVFQTEKTEIEAFYDEEYNQIEEEATLRQSFLEEKQVSIEAQMDAYTQEESALKDQKSKDIQNNTVKLS